MSPARRAFLHAVLALAVVATALPTVAAAKPVAPVPSNVFCDPLDPAACMLPFPNNFFTKADPSSETGVRVNFTPDAMPRNGTEVTEGGEGKPVDPLEWNRNDGFSPGSMVMTYVPGIDLHATWGTQDRPHNGAPNEPGYFDYRDHIADIGLYENPDAPIVIIDAETGERHPFWSEVDQHPLAVDAEEQLLILRPAVNFEEGRRYVVALRNLKSSDGSTIEARPEFAAYRDGTATDARQTYFDDAIFPVLEQAGIARDDLYLAWDFTVASEENLAGRILSMRDQAFAQIGDTDLADGIVQGESPEFVIDRTEEFSESWTDSRGVSHSEDYRRIRGRVTVPNFMDRVQQTEAHFKEDGKACVTNPRDNSTTCSPYYDVPAPGSRLLDVDMDGEPEQNPVESEVQVPFVCRIQLNGEPNNGVLYGHGLLGDREQVNDIRSPQRYGPFYGCAADWWGMSTADVPTVAAILADFSNFPSLPDRAQQGFLNFMFLGRAMVHPEGFAAAEEFKQGETSLVNVATDDFTPLYYDGNSQGGIMGGSLVAVSPDIQRGILGVPAMNYSTLLNRSVDWEGEYAEIYHQTYQDPIERQIVFSLAQMLWDRGEANGYAAHMTDDPYANTPAHDVMLQVAFSDHQVTNHAAEVEARTIGAPIMTPGLPEGVHWEMNPYFTDTASYPYKGSALIYWDSGNATPPNGNIPASQGDDPHSHGRKEPAAGWQEAHFLLTGWMEDVCGGGDYLTRVHPANGGNVSCVAPDRPAGTFPDPEPTETATPTPDPTGTPTPTPTEEQPRATTVEFTDESADGGQYSDETLFEASLEDENGLPIAGEEITFELNGADSQRSFTATTDALGIARVTPTITERPGAFRLIARYGGSDGLLPDATEVTFPIDKEDTATDLSVEGKGSKQSLHATLSDADSSTGVADRTITFLADGDEIGTAVTRNDGTATLAAIPAKYRGGHHDYAARFGGDDYYLGSRGQTST